MTLLSFAYLGALLASIAGMAMVDRRWRLALWHDPRRTLVAVAASTAVLLVWDLVAIAVDLFRIGDSAGMTGIELAPHLPLEEPIFLVFLSYVAVVLWRAAMHGLAARDRAVAEPVA
ncbi:MULTISPECIES: lycopene cyclase domain-containing protein [unclassified Agrococcus]|uniref:lycopene cyclase domain-containing protein n=1 Tax=unclassified Agrococcus TaxID=2615065 RepID=UPI003609D3DA